MVIKSGIEHETNGPIVYNTIRELVVDIRKGFMNGGCNKWVEFKNEIMPRMIVNTIDGKINISIYNKDPTYFWDKNNEFSIEYAGSEDMIKTIMDCIIKVNEDVSYAEIFYNEIKESNGELHEMNIEDKKIVFKKGENGVIHIMQKNASRGYEITGFVNSSQKLEKIIKKAMVVVN